MASYIHQTPGRIRVQIAELKNNAYLADTLRRHLTKVPGVHKVSANSVTGSLKLFFDESSLYGWEILAILKKGGLLGNICPLPTAKAATPLRVESQPAPKVQLSPEAKKILFQLATIAVTALVERSVSRVSLAALKSVL